MTQHEKRTELARFLRIQRAKLSPAEVGLPRTARRKTAGLRREEVAQLASVGVTWYTWLEQGRNINVSTQVLDSLAQTFKLTPAEKNYLFLLAGQAFPIHPASTEEHISDFLTQFLKHMEPDPAYITDRRWDILAWNQAASQAFTNFESIQPEKRNIVRIVFTDAEYRNRCLNWEDVAQHVLAQLRGSHSRYYDDLHLTNLIQELLQCSTEFAHWWPLQEVQELRSGHKNFMHPQAGPLIFEHSTFHTTDSRDLNIAVYLPADAATARKLEQLAFQSSKR